LHFRCSFDKMLFQRLFLTKYNSSVHFKLIRLITTSTVHIEFKDGLANITVPLPSRGESCVFQVMKQCLVGGFIFISFVLY
jgi:hypothetical protein